MPDPRFLGAADVKAAKFGDYFRLDNVAYMQAGKYGAPVVDTGNYREFYSLWCRVTGVTGRGYAQRLWIEMTGLTSRSSQALRAEAMWSHSSGFAASGGSAIHAAAELSAGNTGHSGLMVGLNASIIAAEEARSLQGTYACLALQTEFKTGNVMPGTTAFIFAQDAGAVKTPYFLYLPETAPTCVADAGGATAGKYLRVRVGSTEYKILLYAVS